MSTAPARRRATWDDLLEAPDGFIGEIVDGEVTLTPRPGFPHAESASDLGALLGGPFRFGHGGGPGGWVILHEPPIAFGDDIRVPDLGGWKKDRYAPPERGPMRTMPDWICELLSPGTALADRSRKLPLYARHGVPHLWLVDPVEFTLEVYRLASDGYVVALTAGGADRVRAEPFGAIEIDLRLLWGGRYVAPAP